MLDGLVRWAVFAEADGVVSEDKNVAQLHQRGHAQRITRVIGEGQERAGVRNESTVQRHAVGDRGHGEFAHAEIDVVAGVVLGHGFRAGPVGEHAAGQIRRAADKARQVGRQGFNGLLRGFARGDGFRFFVQLHDQRHHHFVPLLRQLVRQAMLEGPRQYWIKSTICLERLIPCGFQGNTIFPPIPCGINVFRYLERGVVPTERGARRGDFFFAKRRTMGRVGALLSRCTLADNGFAANHRRLR